MEFKFKYILLVSEALSFLGGGGGRGGAEYPHVFY